MSDPVSQSEIEDVLASIRRLVAEGGRSGEPAGHGQPKAPGSEKLVLTPALRVAEPDDPPISDSAGQAPWAHPEADSPDKPVPQPERVEDDPERPSAAQGPAEPDGPAADEPAQGPEPEHLAVEEAVLADLSEMPGAEDAVSADGPAPDPASQEPRAPETGQDEQRSRTESLESKIAELETMIGGTAEDWESEGDEPHRFPAAPTLDWEDHAPGETDDETSGPGGQMSDADMPGKGAERDLGLLDDADTVIDEEMLRDMVTEIVRQELQGALGERITRNVRKLVRREIHRALAAQDLE
ncbi:MAG: hypothetical protein ACLFRU_08285 [Paracoccaceae bacterium]